MVLRSYSVWDISLRCMSFCILTGEYDISVNVLLEWLYNQENPLLKPYVVAMESFIINHIFNNLMSNICCMQG